MSNLPQLSPSLLHLRFIGADENEPGLVQVYLDGQLQLEKADIDIGDMARLVSAAYGVSITMDRIDVAPEQQLTVITADHLVDPVLFDTVSYPSDVHLMHATQSFRRALNGQILDAAKKLGIPIESIPGAIMFADHPQSPGNHRVYAVQRRVNPAYAQFLTSLFFVPGEKGFQMEFSEIDVQQGEFGKGDIVLDKLVK